LQRVLFSDENSATAAERGEAKRLLSLLHRLFLRAQEGQKAWQKTTLFTPPGAQLRKPNGIAADIDGRLVITDDAGSVYLLNAEGQRMLYATTKSPRRPLFDMEGNAWFLTNISIEAMNGPRMARLLSSGRSKPLSKIVGAQQGAFGEWVVIDSSIKGVSVYDNDRTNKGTFAVSTLPNPADVATDSRGKVFILDSSNRSIMSLTPNRRPDRRINVSSKSPEALAIDELGNFYVLDGENRTVDIYDAAGRSIQSLGPVLPSGIELRRPTDVAVDGHGVIYVADPKLDAIAVIE
jgi:DNA-binding beta-propeller fold protein YncE